MQFSKILIRFIVKKIKPSTHTKGMYIVNNSTTIILIFTAIILIQIDDENDTPFGSCSLVEMY